MVSHHKTCLICFTRTCQKREVNLFSKLGQGRTLMCVRGLLLVWVIWSAGLVNRKFHFGIGTNQGTIPSGFPDIWWLFWDVPGTDPEQVRTCGFRKSSSFDKAPKIRYSGQIKSWDSFLVSLPSISTDTWVTYSSVIPGTNVLWLAFPSTLLCIPRDCSKLSFIPKRYQYAEEGKSQQSWTLN